MVLTKEQELIIKKYCDNDLKELKRICYPIISIKPNLFQYEYDDLYDDAMKVLMESVVSYDENKECSFETFLRGNIKRSFYDYTRDKLRWKRCNLEIDKNRRIKLDEKGNPIPIADISLDTEIEGIDLKEKIQLDYSVEEESLSFVPDEKVESFLDSLSKIQKNILLLRMEGLTPIEVREKLNITYNEYVNEIASIKMNRGLSVFAKNKDIKYITEENKMEERVIEISESENYRTDKFSMYSLLQDKKSGDMNCNYIAQRLPFQWTDEEVNRYICRILSNLPVPELIICEQKKKGLTIAYLIDGLQRLSYAEAFKENQIKIGSKGAERHLIQYREYMVDENNKRILDEDGLPKYNLKVCDVIGMNYGNLPEELKKRFNNFNFTVTKYFDCTDEQIMDHMRDYNSHAAMNKEQGSITKISARTAKMIKDISCNNTFFKNCGKFTLKTKIKGKLERAVEESLMLLFFKDHWKPDLDYICKYIDTNATEEHFNKVDSYLTRLANAIGDDSKELKELFTSTSTPIWLSVFDEFLSYGLDNSKFISFLKAYKTELKFKEIDGVSMNNYKTSQNKKMSSIEGKIKLIVALMEEYLHIEKENNITETEVGTEKSTENILDNTVVECENNSTVNSNIECVNQESDDVRILDFVKRNVSNDVDSDDVEFYQEMIDDCVKIDSPVYEKCKTALVALMGYACKENRDQDFEHWIETYSKENTEFSPSQDVNYTYMKHDFQNYIARNEVCVNG